MFNLFNKKKKKDKMMVMDIDSFFDKINSYKPTIFTIICWKIKGVYRELCRIPHKLVNIKRWIPVIWKDNDYDQIFLFDVMIFKLKNMEKFFNSDWAMSYDAKLYAEDIHKAVELLEYIRNEQYEEDGMKPYYDRYPLEIKNTKEYSMESNKFFNECLNRSEELYQEKMTEFCTLLKDKVRYWWD